MRSGVDCRSSSHLAGRFPVAVPSFTRLELPRIWWPDGSDPSDYQRTDQKAALASATRALRCRTRFIADPVMRNRALAVSAPLPPRLVAGPMLSLPLEHQRFPLYGPQSTLARGVSDLRCFPKASPQPFRKQRLSIQTAERPSAKLRGFLHHAVNTIVANDLHSP